MFYSDRSRVETAWACPRKQWWNYYFGGRGVVPVGEAPDLAFGKAVHAALEHQNHDKVVSYSIEDEGETPDGYPKTMEWEALYFGLTEVLRRVTIPNLKKEYHWLESEMEISVQLSPELTWMTRLDGNLERKSDGLHFVLEAKTSSWMEDLAKQARRNFQLLMELDAYQQLHPDVRLGGAIILALNKGSRKRATKWEQENGKDGHRRLSPFTYWYKRELASGEVEYRLDWAKGWDRTPTWEIPDWFNLAWENLEFRQVFEDQVVIVPGVDFDPLTCERVKRQITSGEVSRHEAVAKIEQGAEAEWELDMSFPQNFNNCENDRGFRKPCVYQECCFGSQVGRDPVESGLYEWRVPNHPMEVEGEQKEAHHSI